MLKTETVRIDSHIALSGSGGLIGSALSRQLVDRGYHVRRLVRSRPSNSNSSGERVNDLVWSPEKGLLNPTELNQVGCVVHLAGRSIASRRWSDAEKMRIKCSRVEATKRLVEQICHLDSPPAVFVCASAIGIYGDRGDVILDEKTPAADSFLAELACQWEEACQPLLALGVRVVHARFGIVLSSSGGALAKVVPLFRWRLGGRLGSGKQYWSWIGLGDCLRALQWLIDNPHSHGAFNIVSPQPVTNAQFTQALAHALHVPALVPTPAWALRIAAGEMADALLLSSSRVVPTRLIEEGFSFEQPELQAFLRAECLRYVMRPAE